MGPCFLTVSVTTFKEHFIEANFQKMFCTWRGRHPKTPLGTLRTGIHVFSRLRTEISPPRTAGDTFPGGRETPRLFRDRCAERTLAPGVCQRVSPLGPSGFVHQMFIFPWDGIFFLTFPVQYTRMERNQDPVPTVKIHAITVQRHPGRTATNLSLWILNTSHKLLTPDSRVLTSKVYKFNDS